MKKLVGALAAILICFTLIPLALAEEIPPSDIPAKYAVLMDAKSGEILFDKNGSETAFPASTTKIMTCILALEKGDLDEMVTIPSVTSKGSCLKIKKGATMSLRSLMYGMMLVSGNDCAEAIAIHIGGTKDEFVSMMNKKAAELGMSNTHFVEPSGLHKEEHTTTANDMAVLTRYALMDSPKKDDFRAIIKRGTYTIEDCSDATYPLENSNRLLFTPEDKESYEYAGTIGVKTGDTDYAGRCLVAAAERNGTTLIAVLFSDPDKFTRFPAAAKLFDYGFANISTLSAVELGLPATVEAVVKNCSFDDEHAGMLSLEVDLAGKTVTGLKDEVAAIKNNASAITTSVATNGELTAPVEEGDLVATVTYQYEGKTLFTADARATRGVAAMGGGVMNTPDAQLFEASVLPPKPASPWVFWVLLIVVILVVLFAVRIILVRRRSRRRRSRSRRGGGYIYRR